MAETYKDLYKEACGNSNTDLVKFIAEAYRKCALSPYEFEITVERNRVIIATSTACFGNEAAIQTRGPHYAPEQPSIEFMYEPNSKDIGFCGYVPCAYCPHFSTLVPKKADMEKLGLIVINAYINNDYKAFEKIIIEVHYPLEKKIANASKRYRKEVRNELIAADEKGEKQGRVFPYGDYYHVYGCDVAEFYGITKKLEQACEKYNKEVKLKLS